MSHFELIEQYQDRLAQAERGRDEARAEVARLTKERETVDLASKWEAAKAYAKLHARLVQAVALLREVVTILRPKPEDHGFWHNEAVHAFRDVLPRIDAHLAGQPAPVKPTVDDAMVERAIRGYIHGGGQGRCQRKGDDARCPGGCAGGCKMIGDANVRKARKNHRCNWCGERICAGENYESTFQCCDGDAWRSKMHMGCGVASRAYDYEGDTIQLEGQFQRGHIHEVNYYSIMDGVKCGCPGCKTQAALEGKS